MDKITSRGITNNYKKLMTNILAIDYGSKNIGLAGKIGDDNPIVPYDILANDQNTFINLDKIINEKNINFILIGMPYCLSGKSGPQAEIVQKFAQNIEDKFNLEIEFIDERLTSKLFDDQMPNSDSMVAYHLLDSYLKRSKKWPKKKNQIVSVVC